MHCRECTFHSMSASLIFIFILPFVCVCTSQEDQKNTVKTHHNTLGKSLLNAETNKSLLVVAQDGTGNFRTINQAIDHIPDGNAFRAIVYIKPGVYREKIVIPITKPFVTLQGAGDLLAYITWNDTASDNGTVGMLRTYNSATVVVNSKYFIARNITFENAANVYSQLGELGMQAVAVRITADMGAFYNCRFFGRQDTLYDHKGRHYFKNCFIQGTVDFIFGYGRSLYQDCHLNSISNGTGSLTAQKRNSTYMNSGFSFVNCIVTGSGNIYLGRAWGDRSRVVYSYTYMDALVLPQGWHNWNHPERNRTVFYGQYKCTGPGAITDSRVPWAKVLSYEEARPFLDTEFIHGASWLLTK